ncbi:hypothetical protein GQ42DRAFT_176021 [Ramicandelaber brevisporus]|nr:hypothetical protein GQ42DRAFT_176021 [Ramicandelaber brevisporus]
MTRADTQTLDATVDSLQALSLRLAQLEHTVYATSGRNAQQYPLFAISPSLSATQDDEPIPAIGSAGNAEQASSAASTLVAQERILKVAERLKALANLEPAIQGLLSKHDTAYPLIRSILETPNLLLSSATSAATAGAGTAASSNSIGSAGLTLAEESNLLSARAKAELVLDAANEFAAIESASHQFSELEKFINPPEFATFSTKHADRIRELAKEHSIQTTEANNLALQVANMTDWHHSPYADKLPDYARLADKHPQLSKLINSSEQDESGDSEGGARKRQRAVLNFGDPNVVREINYALLKEDFGLAIEMPADSLCPTVPNRASYLEWIMTIVHATSADKDMDTVYGIDIGCGASCIYPLLASRLIKDRRVKMVGTDIDSRSIDYAMKNVERNKLSGSVSIVLNPDQSVKLPMDIILNKISKSESSNEQVQFDFTMCNPPFYKYEDDIVERRNAKKPKFQHKNDTETAAASESDKAYWVGTKNEMITEGGEMKLMILFFN